MPATRGPRRRRRRPDTEGIRINAEGITRPFELATGESLRQIAWRWSYVLRNRTRWTGRGEAARRQRKEAQELLRGFGLQPADTLRMADAGLVEVSIPYEREEEGWEARIFPWEYVLAAATRERRHATGRDFTVVRHLRRRDRKSPGQRPVFIYIESAPVRPLSDAYDFSDERALAQAAARAAGLDFHQLINPTLDELEKRVETLRPRVLHLAGFDINQARQIVAPDAEEEGDDRHASDGYVMSDGGGGFREVRAPRLAEALTFDGTAPSLVSCNILYSAPRTAALAVALGARAAIGFQDTFDDALAELFYATFYRAWTLSGEDVVSAFRYAWEQVHAQGRKILGSGLVLWNADSIVRAPGRPIRSTEAITEEWVRRQRAEPVTAATARQDLAVTVKHVPQLNYSILHNNRPLFEVFTISKTRDDIGAVEGVEVNVELHAGGASYPFRLQTSIPATQSRVDIADRIRVSLASTLARAVHESIHTSLFVEVIFEHAVLFKETRRVTLLPVDEWQDSDDNRKWLPSFVLPRDPAVARIIELSQRYLQALEDDPTAGFDGYQCIEAGERGALDCTGVDLQVRAIWSALLYETPLAYINPPPTFTDASQRLRTPSDVVDGHRGTCIDLALLVASCLEYVGIYPTIVLLSDHAFPCYWRAEKYYEDFSDVRSQAIDPRVLQTGRVGAEGPAQTDSWCYVRAHFREVLGEITAGRLVPLEATCLCWKNSFAEACEQGMQNLSRRSRFDSMLDIRSARVDEVSPVTPLPILRLEV